MSKKREFKSFRKFFLLISSLLKKKGVLFSLVSALFLLIATYFVNNFSVLTGESIFQYYLIQLICDKIGIEKNVSYGNIELMNTSYDKMLVPTIDHIKSNSPDTLGETCITDRKELSEFLRLLKKSDSYKFIILDIAFDESDKSQYDDTLYSRINSMRNIVIANDTSIDLDSRLKNQNLDALVSYYITKTSTNFARYKYSEEKEKSIPLFVYEKLHPERIMKRYGFFPFYIFISEGHLCQNSNFLTFDNFLTESDNETDTVNFNKKVISKRKYSILGKELKKFKSEHDRIKALSYRTKNKIVIIGDLKNDVADTYQGEKPGSLLIARALQTLEERKNIVSIGHSFLWFIVFFIISYVIYLDRPLSKYIRKKIPYKFVHMLLSLLKYGIILFLCSFIEYAYFDRVYGLIVPICFFTLLKLFVQYRKLDTL